MEYIRVFESTQDAEQQLAQITHPTLSAVRGGGFIGLHQGVEPTPPGPDYSEPFYIEDVSGSENTVSIVKNGSAPTLTIEKSTDGKTWETMGTTSTTAITATIPANSKLYLRCNTNRWTSTNQYANIINTNNNCNIGGNIMSLVYGSNFTGNETTFPSESTYIFNYLFKNNSHIINATNLLLPATTLVEHCYRDMFSDCTSLISAPVLRAEILAGGCCQGMFRNCSSLITAPVLSAETLASQCYNNMFAGCTALTNAPALPATTLVEYCYTGMFKDCTSLTIAPELPATTLVASCYKWMFQNCSNLNYIKCLATYVSAYNCISDWVSGVAATGTFVKNPNMSGWTEGNNGIPSGWTVQDAA